MLTLPYPTNRAPGDIEGVVEEGDRDGSVGADRGCAKGDRGGADDSVLTLMSRIQLHQREKEAENVETGFRD